MELCGAHHFGQFARVYSSPAGAEKFPSRTGDDLEMNAAQTYFGHPYAFIGIPGIGAGNGWEAINLPTSIYLRSGLLPKAEIRLGIYMDYIDSHYHVSPHTFIRLADTYHTKNAAPAFETQHKPYGPEKVATKCKG
jgi:hypothetical protein